jgi:hypothetical protein
LVVTFLLFPPAPQAQPLLHPHLVSKPCSSILTCPVHSADALHLAGFLFTPQILGVHCRPRAQGTQL